MEILELQNRKLAAQLSERRSEVRDLEHQLEIAHRRSEERQRLAFSLRRRWMQLNDDLSVLYAQSGLRDLDGIPSSNEEDPFLAQILEGTGGLGARQEGQGNESQQAFLDSLDSELVEREEKTKRVLAKILKACLKRSAREDGHLDGGEVLQSEAEALAEGHRKMAAQSREDRKRIGEVEDALFISKQQNSDLMNAMEDLRAELASVRRKLASAEAGPKKAEVTEEADVKGNQDLSGKQMEIVQAAFDEERAALAAQMAVLKEEAEKALKEKASLEQSLHETQSCQAYAERSFQEDRSKLQSRLESVLAERDQLAKTAYALRAEKEKWNIEKLHNSSNRDALYELENRLKRHEEELRLARLSRPRAYEKAEQDLLQNVVKVIKDSRQELESLLQSISKVKTDLHVSGKRKREDINVEGQEACDGSIQKELELSRKTVADLQERLQTAEEAASALRMGTESISLDAEIKALHNRLRGIEADFNAEKEARAIAEEERDAFAGELDGVAMALEELSAQNKRLLEQLAASCEDQLQLQLASAKQLTELNELQKATEDLEEQLKLQHDIAEDSKEKAKRAESRFSEMRERATSLSQRLSVAEEQRDRFRLDASNATADLGRLEQQLRASKDLTDKFQSEAQSIERKASRDRSRCAMLESEVKALKAQVEQLKSLVGKDISEVNDSQVKALRQIVKCPVCSSRDKEVVITKCYHLFCQQCIQENLDSRHRKCPGCGVAFGANDVKRVYLS